MLHNLGSTSSLITQYISEIRSSEYQQNRMVFRKNMERIGEIMAYEISKTLPYQEEEVETPLGTAKCMVLEQQPIIATILRAGLALHTGFLDCFDHADNAFISAYRKHHKDGSFDIEMEYVSCPNIEDRILIIVDPMLATGSSMVLTIKELYELGKPAKIHIATAISSTQGIEHVKANLGKDIDIWTAAVDDELTAKSYIVPGLGDAGDLAYGLKIQD